MSEIKINMSLPPKLFICIKVHMENSNNNNDEEKQVNYNNRAILRKKKL